MLFRRGLGTECIFKVHSVLYFQNTLKLFVFNYLTAVLPLRILSPAFRNSRTKQATRLDRGVFVFKDERGKHSLPGVSPDELHEVQRPC